MNADLDRLQTGLVAALAAQIVPGRGLHDPHSGTPSPPDHYGHTAAALALAAHDADLWPAAHAALGAWLAIDDARIGHLPFNRLMLLLLGRVAADTGAPAAGSEPIRTALGRCTLRRTYPSNNWTLLAQTCRLIEAPAAGRPAESARLCALLDRWTTRAGAFIDFPARPGKRFSTPIAYHHKALFLAALAACLHDDPELVRHARRLLDWLVHCWDPAGYAGGLGRSNHALFGDGCLLAALILLGFDIDDAQTPIAALARRLQRQRRPDGLLWLTPAGPETGDASWDGYMHLSVYNAWAAALIAAARHLRRHASGAHASPKPAWHGADTGCFHDDEAGILYLRTASGLNAMLTTRGQAPQSFSRDEIDFRYAGGVIAHLSAGGEPLVAPPVRCTRERLLAAPALAGWTPVLQKEGELFALTDFDRVTIEPRESGVSVRLEGQPVALTRPAARSLLQRAIAAIDWRLLGGRLGRRASLGRARLQSVTATLHIELSASPAMVSVELGIDAGGVAGLRHLNPNGHSLISLKPAAHSWVAAPLPASLAHATGRCLTPRNLAGENHHFRLRGRIAPESDLLLEGDSTGS